jgi:hypothetical protein
MAAACTKRLVSQLRFLCLSRACLGKIISFLNKDCSKKTRFANLGVICVVDRINGLLRKRSFFGELS